MRKISLTLLAGVLLNMSSLAQSPTAFDSFEGELNTISTSVPFLLIAPDSRAGAMGDVGAATSPDHNSIHWNASKFAFIEDDRGASMSYTPWLQDLVPEISLSYLSGFKRLNSKSTIAGSMRYFSLGEIQFTDAQGQFITNFNPNEFTIDGAYAMKLSENFSTGLAMRYIYSNLTGGIQVPDAGGATKPGTSFAVDLSSYFQSDNFEIDDKEAYFAAGLNLSNVGNKISYTDGGEEHFLPTNGRLGANLFMELDEYNTVSFAFDINKLLVPTPPIYDSLATVPGPENIISGKDPNVGVLQGMFQSFSDAPGGIQEELNELMYSVGAEYWYLKQFAFRGGYFHEHATKGARKYFTVGVGLKMNVFSLDMAFLLPATRGVRSPLANTLRFTLLFDMAALYATDKE
ncbi:MAG: type IX secretion system outer membrane channel protein PorV [Flavobacteriales bacterium]|nr:type IX secretion system outer membrane channel protein PorV [Flavobacteriales bacterium]